MFGRRVKTSKPAPLPPQEGATFALQRIGVVHNHVRRRRLEGWEAVESRIELETEFGAGLAGIEGFSHLIVLSWLHLAAAEPHEALAIRPQNHAALPLLGVLALRVAARPNPIGMSVVRLLGREATVLRVLGLDLVDGTPVLDVKPYLPPYDSVPDAVLPPWARGG